MTKFLLAGRLGIAVGLAVMCLALPANAATVTLQVNPAYIEDDDDFTIDVVISDLGVNDVVAGLTLQIQHDLNVSFLGYTADPGDVMGIAGCEAFMPTLCDGTQYDGPSRLVDLFLFADPILDYLTLHTAQHAAASFVIASLSFHAVFPGTALFTVGAAPLFGTILTDFDFNALETTTAEEVGVFIAVPEPGSLSLLGLGVLALAAARRRRQARRA